MERRDNPQVDTGYMMRCPVYLPVSSVALALDPDRSVLQLLTKQSVARILNRTQINSEFHVVVALSDSTGWWNKQTRLGVFLQRRGEPGMIYQVAADKGIHDDDCFVQVERATEKDVVRSCRPEKGGPGAHRKFVYDVRAKALAKRVDYSSSSVKRRVTLKYQSEPEPPFRLLAGRVEVPLPKQTPLTQSTYDKFALTRPEHAIGGLTRKPATMNEEIGPTQLVAGAPAGSARRVMTPKRSETGRSLRCWSNRTPPGSASPNAASGETSAAGSSALTA